MSAVTAPAVDRRSVGVRQPLVGVSEENAGNAPGGWQMVSSVEGFLKWQYKETAYRVIADLDEERGHWRVLFTSVYGGYYNVAGNLGGSQRGMMKATTEARAFMEENKNGCPPPSEY